VALPFPCLVHILEGKKELYPCLSRKVSQLSEKRNLLAGSSWGENPWRGYDLSYIFL